MMEKCFFVLVSISIIFAISTGNLQDVSNAVVDGATKAISLVLSLAGAMCLWSGIMEVLREAGAVQKLSRILSPILRRVFPKTWESGQGSEEICAALSANILGIGNAATPLALSAMEKMQAANPNKERATDDMVTFAVLGASSLDLLPTTLIALRRTAGSAAPYKIILPVWICSLVCAVAGVLLSKLCAGITRKAPTESRKKNKKRIMRKAAQHD